MTEPATREELHELFGEGFADGVAAEAEERWGGTDAWRQSGERTAGLTKEQWAELQAEGRRITDDFAAAFRLGVPPEDRQAHVLAERHRLSLERFYDCPPAFHCDIADLYVTDPRFAREYDAVEPGLAAYVRACIHANAANAANAAMARPGQEPG